MSQENKHLEIERRWLLKGLPDPKLLVGCEKRGATFITVYILDDPELEVRIRKRADQERVSYSVVTKVGSGLTRYESPKLPARAELFDLYLDTLRKPFLTKLHLEILLSSGQKWELSRFHNPSSVEGLVLIEMEFDSEEEARQFSEKDFPEWLKPLVVKEVTDDSRYNGKNLAVHGRPNPV